MATKPRRSRTTSEEKRLAEALQTSEARLRAVIESLPLDFWMIGEDGRYVMQNSTCRQLWGDVVGKRPEDVAADPAAIELWQENNRRAFAGETVREEVQFRLGEELRHFYNVVAPIAAEGRTLGILGINLDITDRMRAEEALRRRNEELRRANRELKRLTRSKDQLTAMISHELRTPLVTGLGYIEMLLEGKLGPVSSAIRSRLSIAQRNLRRLAQLIEGVLRYQRLVAAGFDPATLRATSFDVARLAEELVDELATRREPAPALELDADLPHVTGDRELIRMALSNLLDNASTHAGAGASVSCRLRRDPQGVEVTIVDDGVGIPAEILDTALEPFIRGASARRGSGLGLAIVQAILKAHGSTIELESERGGGTRVRFRLRAADVDQAD
jgi:PAS domain S-box-containing protein